MEKSFFFITGRSLSVQPAGTTRYSKRKAMRFFVLVFVGLLLLTACGGAQQPRVMPICDCQPDPDLKFRLRDIHDDVWKRHQSSGGSHDQLVQEVVDRFEAEYPGWGLEGMTSHDMYEVMETRTGCSNYFILSYEDSWKWGVEICVDRYPPSSIYTFSWPPPPRP